MMIDRVTPEGIWLIDHRDYLCSCVWVEDHVRKGGTFRSSHLQAVYADGAPEAMMKKRRSVQVRFDQWDTTVMHDFDEVIRLYDV